MPLPPLSIDSAAGPATSSAGGDFVVQAGGAAKDAQPPWMWVALTVAGLILIVLLIRR
jgi:hypothetical protein